MLRRTQTVDRNRRKCRIDYKIASNRHELEQAFQLVYGTYTHSGLLRQNPFGMRILPHQLLPSTDVFVATEDSQVVSTASLIRDGQLGLPMDSIYSEEAEQLRRRGKKIGEVSSLADDGVRTIHRCMELFRLLVHTALDREVDVLVITVHPKHVRFYERCLAFKRTGSEVAYPAVCDHPAIAMALDFDEIDQRRLTELKKFFARPFPNAKLRRQPIAAADRDYFQRVVQFEGATDRPNIGNTAGPSADLVEYVGNS